MEIKMQVKNGIRFGTFKEGAIEGTAPSQAIVHPKNFNYMDAVGNPIDFGTKFLEIYFRPDLSIFEKVKEETETDKAINAKKESIKQKQLKKIQDIIADSPDKVCLLVLDKAKTRKIDKKSNKNLVQFQIQAGFKYIKAFFKKKRNALEDFEELMKFIPEGKCFVPVLDEKLDEKVFADIYEKALKNGCEIIGFLGRSGKDRNIRDNRSYIMGKPEDKVIRLVSEIGMATKNWNSKSLLFSYLGYDVFSFTSKYPSTYHIKQPLRIMRNFKYGLLSDNQDAMCEIIRGNRVIDTVESYKGSRQETIPTSVFSHININKCFKNLADNFTHEQLEKVLADDIKALTETQ